MRAVQFVESPDILAVITLLSDGAAAANDSIASTPFESCTLAPACGAATHVQSTIAPVPSTTYTLTNTTLWCGPSWTFAEAAALAAERVADTGGGRAIVGVAGADRAWSYATAAAHARGGAAAVKALPPRPNMAAAGSTRQGKKRLKWLLPLVVGVSAAALVLLTFFGSAVALRHCGAGTAKRDLCSSSILPSSGGRSCVAAPIDDEDGGPGSSGFFWLGSSASRANGMPAVATGTSLHSSALYSLPSEAVDVENAVVTGGSREAHLPMLWTATTRVRETSWQRAAPESAAVQGPGTANYSSTNLDSLDGALRAGSFPESSDGDLSLYADRRLAVALERGDLTDRVLDSSRPLPTQVTSAPQPSSPQAALPTAAQLHAELRTMLPVDGLSLVNVLCSKTAYTVCHGILPSFSSSLFVYVQRSNAARGEGGHVLFYAFPDALS